MKRISLLLMLIGGLTLSAQVPIVPRDTNLFYDWWYEDLITDTAQRINTDIFTNISVGDGTWSEAMMQPDNRLICGEVAKYFYTDTALTILGIRFCSQLESQYFHDTCRVWGSNPDSIWCGDYFLSVYKKEGDSMLMLGRKHIFYDYPFNNYGMMNINLRMVNINRGCELHLLNEGIPSFEYYFDQPITVEDSFYIGATLTADSLLPRFDYPHIYYRNPYFTNISDEDIGGDYCYHSSHNFPALKYRYRLMTFDTVFNARYSSTCTRLKGWRDSVFPCCLMVFPIIKYGSDFVNCTPVEGLHVTKQDGATFLFEWSDSTLSHLGWEFTYVPEGSSPDIGSAVECSRASHSVTIEPGIQYRAYVRPRCLAGHYGDWGSGEPFCYNCPQGSIIDVGASISMHPNPTTSAVDVVSPYNIQRIEVFDTQGKIVSTSTANCGNARIDLSPFADGTYLIKVHTTDGTATKQVVKASGSNPLGK